jgi:formylglycine-generating enzyme required for sulfatase activity
VEEDRVMRGGNFIVRPWNLRSANFDYNVPVHRSIFMGFRVARTIVTE